MDEVVDVEIDVDSYRQAVEARLGELEKDLMLSRATSASLYKKVQQLSEQLASQLEEESDAQE